MQMQLLYRTRVKKVRVFGSNTRKNPKPEVRGRVGLAFKIRGFSGQKPRKRVENSIGSTLKFSAFLQALVRTQLLIAVCIDFHNFLLQNILAMNH